MNEAIFVFGSNLAGRHGKGAALHARQHYGAVYGQAEGMQGMLGRSYAIPTKDRSLKPLPLADIRKHVRTFLAFAEAHPELQFQVTPIGCGLAGYKAEQIAPMFIDAPMNCLMPDEFNAFWREQSFVTQTVASMLNQIQDAVNRHSLRNLVANERVHIQNEMMRVYVRAGMRYFGMDQSGPTIELGDIDVQPEYRRKGLLKRMLDGLELMADMNDRYLLVENVINEHLARHIETDRVGYKKRSDAGPPSYYRLPQGAP